ncbi:hypothetical protein BN988_03204 [Oceanobacillus picturae]|uniref:Uncharacterized protein n=1 Tax=Oceanobacillus picturae TaxID=171693 RepID=W9AG03_9BACI|nr:DUF3231 family protein [Oceanobacillus picturae]CDO04639.1 hypothetical protein BN988_03204 [Oceanobacillus picturae]
MNEEKKIHLDSGEIASLWTAYVNDSMSVRILQFMIQHTQDPDISPAIQHALDISEGHLKQLTAIFEAEEYAIPNGFTSKDVHLDAPWLFSDTFCLTYVSHMAKVGMLSYSGLLSMSTKPSIRDYFTTCLNQTASLYNQTVEIATHKGVNPRIPYIEIPKKADYINSKEYYSGLNPFSDKRPLNAIEISHLYMNALSNYVGMKLCLAFAQTSPNKKVQDFLLRSKEISKKHSKIFNSLLSDNNIATPQLPDVAVSSSTTETFSDKMIMFHMSLLISAGIGNYATGAAASQRLDLAVNYERLSLEVAKLAKSGADLMIENHWLEQPPGTKNKEQLARNKK